MNVDVIRGPGVLDADPADPVPAATREQYAALKARDPGMVLLFRGELWTYFALGADIEELRRIVAGKVAYIADPPERPRRIAIRREDLDHVLGLIVQAGRRAAVLERVEES